jgi:hypothetical protein
MTQTVSVTDRENVTTPTSTRTTSTRQTARGERCDGVLRSRSAS